MYNTNPGTYYPYNESDDRIVPGGFAAPFLLGGIAGSLLTPRPFYPPFYYPPFFFPPRPFFPRPFFPRRPFYPRFY